MSGEAGGGHRYPDNAEEARLACRHCRRTIIGDQWCIRRIAPLRCEPYDRAAADPYEDGDMAGHNNGTESEAERAAAAMLP